MTVLESDKQSASSLQVVGFAGSLRTGSYNKLLLRASTKLAPVGMTIESYDLIDLPLYNEDIEEVGAPASVTAFKQAIAAAHGLLIVTPEYNFGMSAVTKNAIDWASRPSNPSNVLANKPVAIMGVGGGRAGSTSLARVQVRQSLLFPGAIPVPVRDVGLAGGAQNFDEHGGIVDQAIRERVQNYLIDFAGWIRRVNAPAI